MRKPRKDGADTYQRILEAACKVFADKGYWHSTVAEICKTAKSNIAAVNYHFGDKGNLYKEAWLYSFNKSIKSHPPDGGIKDDAPAEIRLRARIKALLERVLDDDSNEFAFLYKEFANPTGLLNTVVAKAIGPIKKGMTDIVKELVKEDISDMEAMFCQMSIMSQCLGLMLGKRIAHSPQMQKMINIEHIEPLTDHITTFALAGINAICEKIVSRSRKNKISKGKKHEVLK